MKLLLPLLLLPAGWLGYRASHASSDVPPCASEDCRMTVECVRPGTCLVTCYDADDAVVCQREVACDGPCERACDEPCEPAKSAASPARAGCDPAACTR